MSVAGKPASARKYREQLVGAERVQEAYQLMPPAWDTLIYVPSIALGPLTRRHLTGLDYFQERNYYYIHALADPTKHVIFILSEQMQDDLLLYHTDILLQVFETPAAALGNLHILKVCQPVDVSLSAAVLADEGVLGRLRSLTKGRKSGFDFWTVGPDEVALANALSLPHVGMPEHLIGADGKADSKRIFKVVGAKTPRDFGVFFDVESLWERLNANDYQLDKTLLLKLNHEEGGNGIARIRIDGRFETADALRAAITIDKPYIRLRDFEEQMALQGVVAELFLVNIIASPSAKMWIDANGTVSCVATHDQVLRDSMYLGCRFPANPAYRAQVIETATVIARQCSAEGWRGIVSIDFLVTSPSGKGSDQVLWAIEINARKGATTHPYFWAKTLTEAKCDLERGLLTVDGREVVYQASEYVASPLLAGMTGASVLQTITDAGLSYHADTKEGVIVHMLSCAQIHLKIGVTSIAACHESAERYIREIQSLLGGELFQGNGPSGSSTVEECS